MSLTKKQQEYYDAYLRLNGNASEVAREFGVNPSTTHRLIKQAKEYYAARGEIPEIGLNQFCETRNVTGVSQYVKSDEFTGWVKSSLNQKGLSKSDIEEMVRGFMDGHDERILPVSFKGYTNSNFLSAYCLGDAHFGMLAYEAETGENYDTKIAERDTKTAFNYLIEQNPDSEVGVLLNVGDIFHTENDDNRTKSGHALDTDTRQSHVRDIVIKTIRYAIDEMLKKHKEVWIISQKGNHDEVSASWLNTILKISYENEPRVKVFSNDRRFTYFHFGKCFVGVHHGDKIRNENQMLSYLVSDYRKELRCYNEILTGHIHHKQFKEVGGIRFESMCSLASKDYYHDSHGYGAVREMKSIVYHKDFGRVMEHHAPIKLVRALQEGI